MELDNKKEAPVIFLEGVVTFPQINLPLLLKKDSSILAFEEAMKSDALIIFALENSPIGTIAHIFEAITLEGGAIKALVRGLKRVKIDSLIQQEPYFRAKFSLLANLNLENFDLRALTRGVLEQFKECINLGKIVPVDVLAGVLNINDPGHLADTLAFNLDLKPGDKQAILEAADPEKRLKKLSEWLAQEIEIIKAGKKIKKDAAKNLGKMSREIYLREQLRNIERELGIDDDEEDAKEYEEKLAQGKFPKKVKEVLRKEIKRLRRIPPMSPEISFLRNYIDWIFDLPWSAKFKNNLDIKKANKILDRDHYGLDKIKERVLEYLAVQKKVGRIRGPILCFVGPPGTGKTSIGKSVAEALGRKFVRVSLGGVRDEAEIRGHRRTYVGALPGRIIQGIKNSGVNNPVFMLDEIDKLGTDFRGDPSSALLEALDPEQNFEFSDHYLEVPYDLSNVLFITTANILSTIPPALRDRLEVIRFSGFTQEEKFHIAKNYIFPKLLKNHGLSTKELVLSDSAFKKVIGFYTSEAGVRGLERQLAKICRKTAKQLVEGKIKSKKVGAKEVEKILGPERFTLNLAEKKDEIGIATGLAWTEAGGEILSIEAVKMPGKGDLLLTGSLGRVMKESAQAALSYAKSLTKKSELKSDIHLHVPSGAIPKDGPSAGVAIAAALISVLENRPIEREIAMTGEVTLRGRVLEVGGIKEKILAAYRSGVKTVVLPKDNKKNLEDIPREIKNKLNFVFASDMKEVIERVIKKAG